jgi:hypothetical protein
LQYLSLIVKEACLDERGSEITEQVFWLGLVILAVLLLLPQLRGVLQTNIQDLISTLGA